MDGIQLGKLAIVYGLWSKYPNVGMFNLKVGGEMEQSGLCS